MESIEEMAAKLDADRREAAEMMTFGQRLLAGPAMFDLGVAMMRAGIRLQSPEADDQTIERMVLDRLRNARRFETKV